MKQARHDVLKRVGMLVAAALVGGGLALFASLYVILNSSTAHLKNFAKSFLEQDTKVARDITQTLDAANHASTPYCSDADIQILRQLLFNSPYLKDVGRVRDGVFSCSAVMGRLLHPGPIVTDKIIVFQKRQVYFSGSLAVAHSSKAEIVSEGMTNVVVSPSVFADFNRAPMTYAGAIVLPSSKQIQKMYTNSPTEMPLELLLTDTLTRRNGMMYYPHCSSTEPDCVLVGMPMKAIWEPHHSTMVGAFASGAVLGLLLSGAIVSMNHKRRSLGNQLRRALRKKALWVVYQPVVDLEVGKIVGCEALVRWADENESQVRPDIFVGIAEEQGFVSEITRFVMERVVSEIGDVLRSSPDFRVSVNLAAMDLTDETFIPWLDALLASKNIPASSIGLELTERSTADRDHVINVIRDLRERGHVVYIDDFGTGYSSLAYLSELSIDVLKIDRAFTKTIGTDSVTATIVPQILEMAKALKLKVVVEGVEELSQAEYLADQHSGIQVQGWLFGRPVPSGDLRAILRKETRKLG